MVKDWSEFIGFEPSPSLRSIASSRGLNARCEFYSAEKLPRAADAIIIDNTLEHVIDPAGMMAEAVRGLAPGGILVVIVPNRRDVRGIRADWRKRHLWIPPDHINYFAAADLQMLFEKVGLRMRYFGLRPLRLLGDLRFVPRAFGEQLGLALFGLNVYGLKDM